MSVRQMDLVWRHSKATGKLLLVALALADWADDDGYVYPSFRQLAKKARVDRSTAIRAVQQLMTWSELERRETRHHETSNTTRAAFLRWQSTNSYRLTVAAPASAGSGTTPPPRQTGGRTTLSAEIGQVVAKRATQVVAKRGASISLESTDPSVQEKSSGAAAPRSFPQGVEKSTYGHLVKLTHEALDEASYEDIADLSDVVKTRAAQLRMSFDPELLARALSSVLVSRGYDRRTERRAK